jgi:ELWxxDGT repeat protein
MSNPTNLTSVDGMLMFKANTPDQGDWGGEVWRSDGTEAGTVMVKDIYPNPNPINRWPKNLTEAGDTLLFSADDSVHGFELWRSEGTEASTRLVEDINSGEYASGPDWIIGADGLVFFRAFEGASGREIWALVDPSDCHLLILGVSGMGSVPSTDPPQSLGCDPGLYETGELITLTAAPATGWEVTGWTGSDDDGSTSTTNQVTMPGIEHEVTVHYGATPQIFVDGFESGSTTAWSSVVTD